jgi:hypothetical protein
MIQMGQAAKHLELKQASKQVYAKNLNNTMSCHTVLVPGYPSQV